MIDFNVAGLLRESPGASRTYRLRDHYVAYPDLELAGPLSGEIDLQRTNRGLLLRGRVAAAIRRSCARCTDPFVEEVEVPLAEEFLPSVDPDTGTPLAAPDAIEEVRAIDAHHEIHLGEVVREELALSEPMHPLCRPDCPGLCPECGARLDRRHQAHDEAEVDPRLAVLQRFLDRADEG